MVLFTVVVVVRLTYDGTTRRAIDTRERLSSAALTCSFCNGARQASEVYAPFANRTAACCCFVLSCLDLHVLFDLFLVFFLVCLLFVLFCYHRGYLPLFTIVLPFLV